MNMTDKTTRHFLKKILDMDATRTHLLKYTLLKMYVTFIRGIQSQ